MIRVFLLCFISFIVNIKSYGEENPFGRKNSFKINPFSLIDWHNQAFTVAYERSFNYKGESPFSWQLEGGAIFANYVIPNEHYRGMKARGDLRYNFKPHKKTQLFAAINSGISYTDYSTLMTYNSQASRSSAWSWNFISAYKLKLVEFEKTAITVNLILGFNKIITSKMYIEAYAGMGTRKTDISTKTPDFEMPGWNPISYYDMRGYYVVPGKFNYFNMTGGMKFCFIID